MQEASFASYTGNARQLCTKKPPKRGSKHRETLAEIGCDNGDKNELSTSVARFKNAYDADMSSSEQQRPQKLLEWRTLVPDRAMVPRLFTRSALVMPASDQFG